MNFLAPYFTKITANQFSISADQGSDFAKQMAGDFNPIHDADSKRFCVPGDLLFALALEQYGLHTKMEFQFLNLVGADQHIAYAKPTPRSAKNELKVVAGSGKSVLNVECSGPCTKQPQQIESLLRKYVAFSGQNFPPILVPLMQQHQVMVNPQRPLVIYKSMAFEFDTLDFVELDIKLEQAALVVHGRRGNVKLNFSLSSNGKVIASGIKQLLLSGLREYDNVAINRLCDAYLASKAAYS